MILRRLSKPPEEDFPMTPMIDMVFLLLVFFMTVSTLAQADRGVKVSLPESTQSDVAEEFSDRGTISVNGAGDLFIGTQMQSIASMQGALKASLSVNPDLRIQVRADQSTPYCEIKKVLVACAEVGAYEVIYSTYQAR